MNTAAPQEIDRARYVTVGPSEEIDVMLAGVPMRIACWFHDNVAFFREYETDAMPAFKIVPTDADMENAQLGFNRMAEREGNVPKSYAMSFLERNAILELASAKLLDHDVLLIHGSALSIDGTGYIFTAPSGTGKSTHTRLWREVFGDRVRMINDDKPFIRVGEKGVTVYGSPWDGKHHISSNDSAPLGGIVWLTRGAENSIEPMGKAEAFRVLLKQAVRLGGHDEMNKIVGLERSILEKVKFFSLTCNMEREAAITAHNGLECSAR